MLLLLSVLLLEFLLDREAFEPLLKGSLGGRADLCGESVIIEGCGMVLSGLSLSALLPEFVLDCEAFGPLLKGSLGKRTVVLMEAEGRGMHPSGQ